MRGKTTMSRNPLRDAIDGGSESPSESGGGNDSTEEVAKSRETVATSRAQSTDATTSTRGVTQGVASNSGFVDTRMNAGGKPTSVYKQEVDRRASISTELQRQVQGYGGLPKPYDPALLRDVAGHAVVQAYIDTLAQDVAAANWSLEPRDDDIQVEDEARAKAERVIEDIHPEKSFSDVLEQTVRNLLELGDAAWVKHYFSDGDIAEAMPVDSARFYKSIDDFGITENYLEASFQHRDVKDEYDLEEMVWFEWASRTDHKYGMGPTEKGLDVIMLLEELSEKEKKDLIEGMPSGVLSAKEDADNPLPVDEYENVKEDFEQEEGERHRVIVSRGEWDFTNFAGTYQELDILNRNKYWVGVLGAVFKVNPSYAGFDFENTNRATDESQQEAYKQRGFRQTLQQVEEALNKQLIWEDISEDLQFTFEREQTSSERQERVALLSDAAQVAQEWADVGRPVTIDEDGNVHVEPGTVTEEDVASPEGEGGGGFGDVFGSDEREADANPALPSREVAAESDGEVSRAVKADAILLDAFEAQIQPESLDDIQKRSWSGDESVPEYVVEQIQQAFDDGAVFDGLKSVPSEVEQILSDTLERHLTDPDGWSLRGIVDDLTEQFPGVSEKALEVVTRTEVASVMNTAREEGYESRDDSGTYKFYWQGPNDARTTDACDELKAQTNPRHGGTPVSMTDLKRLEEDAQQTHFPQLTEFRAHVVHPNERHTFVRHVGDPRDDVSASVSDASLAKQNRTDAESDDAGGSPVDASARARKIHRLNPASKQDFDDPCWDGYVMVGTKVDENGNEVPNCVPEEEADEVAAAYVKQMVETAKAETLDDLDFGGYPEAASENAQMALDARDDTGDPNDCGTDTGWARANQLANRETLSADTIGRMANFARHEDNKEQDDGEGRADCGWMMWKAWGGDEGIEWAQRMVDRIEEVTED